MVLVLTDFESERLRYILDLMLSDLLGLEYIVVTEVPENIQSNFVVDYRENPEYGLTIPAGKLLHETDIRPVEVNGRQNGQVFELLLDGDEKFDPLAAAFYLTSRYEEYLPHEPDAHERFSAISSCLHALDVLDRPIVNEWALWIKAELINKYPSISFSPRKFEYLSTIDIDQAWKYKHKGLSRTIGGFVGDLTTIKAAKLYERCAVLSGLKQDPFDNFDLQHKWHDELGTKVQYFMQVGERGAYDKNQDAGIRQFRALIRQLDAKADVGIHPSYQSNYRKPYLEAELEVLQDILQRDVVKSRQHFLMHKMPNTYRNLLELGITEDHTMGYSTYIGFRAGIAAPFYFYDLNREEYTDLKLIPFCFMDITPMHYMGKNLEESRKVASHMINKVEQVGGMFCTLWHNESLSDSERWKGWRPLYRHILEECAKRSLKS